MDSAENKRKAKRKDFLCEAKVCFVGQCDYTSLAVKDISASGLRVIIARFVKVGDRLEIKCINGRDIQCQGKVAWVLSLRPSLSNIVVFDVGVEFYAMDAGDREFLEKTTAR
jgi:hypothetical protein